MTTPELLQSSYILGASPYCAQADVGNGFSIAVLVLHALALVWLVLNFISPERKFLLPLKSWFLIFQALAHLVTMVVLISDVVPKDPKLPWCVVYYNGNYVWCRVLLMVTTILTAVTAILNILPCYNIVLMYLHLIVNLTFVIFSWVNFFGTGCSGWHQHWKTVHNLLAQFLMPTLTFIGMLMIVAKFNFRVTKKTVVTKREVIIENEEPPHTQDY
ncbi:hypothetical protein BLNAU_22639 [Blattamonas nauphoetae]|uniref:Uncharacterized protein n=1 Tax=Blattamonas nauphoetae TaxID=2049346 RepID=A0ABQ9WSH4_9EUKA|nr:hypothetical protein BLNAU_22639 [Blattamonas nauphoetae]